MNDRQEKREPSGEVDLLAREVIGACIEVHKELGPGLPEACYQNALAVEFTLRDLAWEQEVPVKVFYKGHHVGEARLDFLVDKVLVVELKSVEELSGKHLGQVLTYLKITDLDLGLLVNFNELKVRDGIRRVVRTGCDS